MKEQQKNPFLFSLSIFQERDVQRFFMENFKMGLFNNVRDQNNHPGPLGPRGPPRRGLLLDDDGNPDFTSKRLTKVGESE